MKKFLALKISRKLFLDIIRKLRCLCIINPVSFNPFHNFPKVWTPIIYAKYRGGVLLPVLG